MCYIVYIILCVLIWRLRRLGRSKDAGEVQLGFSERRNGRSSRRTAQ